MQIFEGSLLRVLVPVMAIIRSDFRHEHLMCKAMNSAIAVIVRMHVGCARCRHAEDETLAFDLPLARRSRRRGVRQMVAEPS